MIALIVTTVDSKNNAEKIAEVLLKERLAACVSIFPVTSLYRRQGKIAKDDESMLFIKTREELVQKVVKRIREIHPYELPEILILRVGASKEYAERVRKETS